MLQIKNVSKSFGSKVVLKNFSYKFCESGTYNLNGPNGSGKTTLMKIIKNIITPNYGEVVFSDKIPGIKKVTYIDANSRSFIHRLSVKSNIEYFSALNKVSTKPKKIENWLEKFNARSLMSTKVSELSSGQLQLIAFIRGMMENPSIILLDECFSNVDETNSKIIVSYLEDYLLSGNKIVISCNHSKDLWSKINGEINLE